MEKSGNHGSPQGALTGSGVSIDVFGYAFHLAWMYLFLYVDTPVGLSAGWQVATQGQYSALYLSSMLALVAVLGLFAVFPGRLLGAARSRAGAIAAPALTAAGTLLWYIAAALGAADGAASVCSVAAGLLTGVGSAALAARWACAFGAAGMPSVIGGVPLMLAAVVAVCVTVPLLPGVLAMMVVVTLPLLSGVLVARADVGGADCAVRSRSVWADGETGAYRARPLYAGMVAYMALLGLILGCLNAASEAADQRIYLLLFFSTATVAVLAVSAVYIVRNLRANAVVLLAVPLCAMACLCVLLTQVALARGDVVGGFLPIGSICLELLFVVALVAFALRFGLSPVRTFALGRITYAVINCLGNEAGIAVAGLGESVAGAQALSLALFTGIELLAIVALVTLASSGLILRGLMGAVAVGGKPGVDGSDGREGDARRRAPFQERLAAFSDVYGLSARERDVAEQLLKGRGYARIQQELGIAEGTVNYHTRNVYAKCGVHTREELIDLFDAADGEE